MTLFARIKIKIHFQTIMKHIVISCTVQNIYVSSERNFGLDCKLFGKSFMWIIKNKGPKIDPCGRPEFKFIHDENNPPPLKVNDDDDDDDNDELLLCYSWPTKGVKPYFQPRPLSEIFTISNLWHAASKIWICAEPDFRLRWMKLCSSDNHCLHHGATTQQLLF